VNQIKSFPSLVNHLLLMDVPVGTAEESKRVGNV